MTPTGNRPLLSVRDLVIEFKTERGLLRAVDGIGFDVMPGETVGLVGESGCGKSITALAILGLIPFPPGRLGAGSSILYQGRELVGLPEKQMRTIRGFDISMIFQEPMTALNPVFTVASQMEAVLMRHKKISRSAARDEAVRMLSVVGIPDPGKRIRDYPHQLSGGMRQRVMIAMALSCDPDLLLADEPTTALDVTVQAQVMEQMAALQKSEGMATVLVTHDLAVVAEFCRKVIVMYCGQIVETGTTGELFGHPRHPYSRGLLNSIPRIRKEKIDRLPVIAGTVPDLLDLPVGCRFAGRCARAQDRCRREVPALEGGDGRTKVACFYPHEGDEP